MAAGKDKVESNNNFDNLSDEEFVLMFAREYLNSVEAERDEDYEINRPQWIKMVEVLDYFYKLSAISNGDVEACEVQPKFMHGGVTATFTVVDLKECDIPEFCEALLKTNAITIDATTDGKVCISVSVPYVYVKKQ